MQCISRVHMSQAVLCEIVQLLVYKSKVVILIGVLGRAHDSQNLTQKRCSHHNLQPSSPVVGGTSRKRKMRKSTAIRQSLMKSPSSPEVETWNLLQRQKFIPEPKVRIEPQVPFTCSSMAQDVAASDAHGRCFPPNVASAISAHA